MDKPKVLVFDIETSGGLKAHMSEVSAFGYKWLGQGKPKILSHLDYPNSHFTNDKPLLKELSRVWNEADAVIAHYGERFDRRFLNSRIERHSLPHLKPIPLIDTWRISKDNFALQGNSLNVLLKFFNCPYQKLDLTYEEWRQVMLGNKKAQRKLNAHCYYDVLGLEWVFEKHLRHYTNKLPSQALVAGQGKLVCPECGGNDLQRRGYAVRRATIMRQYWCKNPACHAWPKGPITGKGVLR